MVTFTFDKKMGTIKYYNTSRSLRLLFTDKAHNGCLFDIIKVGQLSNCLSLKLTLCSNQ